MNTTTSPDGVPSHSFTRHIPAIVRYLMGVPLVIFGLNLWFNFLPQPQTPLPAGAAAFVGALVQSGYMMQLIGTTQFVAGLGLVLNRFVPLALALLAPFIVNSVAFHACLERAGLDLALAFVVMELYLAWTYRRAFAPMLAARVTPG